MREESCIHGGTAAITVDGEIVYVFGYKTTEEKMLENISKSLTDKALEEEENNPFKKIY